MNGTISFYIRDLKKRVKHYKAFCKERGYVVNGKPNLSAMLQDAADKFTEYKEK